MRGEFQRAAPRACQYDAICLQRKGDEIRLLMTTGSDLFTHTGKANRTPVGLGEVSAGLLPRHDDKFGG